MFKEISLLEYLVFKVHPLILQNLISLLECIKTQIKMHSGRLEAFREGRGIQGGKRHSRREEAFREARGIQVEKLDEQTLIFISRYFEGEGILGQKMLKEIMSFKISYLC